MRRLLCACLLPALLLPLRAAAEEEELPPAQYSASLLTRINQYRAEQGMRPLRPAASLALLAHEHSLYMAEHGDISHARFEQRHRRAGSRACAENVGWNFRDPDEQFKGWQNSARHNAVLLDPQLTRGGIAVFDAYVTFFACS